MLQYLKDENFSELIQNEKVLVDFYADWCGPCKMLSPVMEELAKKMPTLSIVKVNIDEHEDLARTYGIMSIPTIILFEKGNIIKKQVGFMPQEALENWLK